MSFQIPFTIAGPGVPGVAGVLSLIATGDASVETWAGVALLVTCGLLALTVIGAVCRGPGERTWWLGFAVFGGGYFAMAHWPTLNPALLPTVNLLLDTRAIPADDLGSIAPALRLLHMLWTLLIGACGAAVTHVLFGGKAPRAAGSVAGAPIDHGSPRSWWRCPVLIGLAGTAAAPAAALAAAWSAPRLWAGLTFLLTCGLLGLAVLGTAFGRGRRREAWIGAALFGLGYLALAWSSPLTTSRPTAHLLNAVFRPSYPTRAVEILDEEWANDAESLRIKRALAEPISIRFPEATRVKTVLEHIKIAMKGSLGRNLRIYADPFEMRSAGVNLHLGLGSIDPANLPRVTIDRENIPAGDALRLCLGQLGLTYQVRAGYVRIIADEYRPLPVYDDPVMLVGHSLLALIAAAVGGVAAPIVSTLCGRRRLSA